MDQVSVVCRRRHLSRRTEQAYRFWIRRYIHFHGRQHPRAVGPAGIVAFINHLAAVGGVAASTQSQALNALLFLYRDVLELEVSHLRGLRRVQRRDRLPVVLSTDEVIATLAHMGGVAALMAHLLYGSGLRVTECMTLRVKDVDLQAGLIHVRAGKGGKDRTTLLPDRLQSPLRRQLLGVARLHKQDLVRGGGFAPLPNALERKYPSASQSLACSSCSPLVSCGPVHRLVAGFGGMRLNRASRRPSRKLCARPASPSTPRFTRYATRSPLTCSQPARTFEPSNCCWVIEISRPP